MAQKVEVILVDDLDGTEAEATVSFALDGAGYEIDLSVPHIRALRDLLELYIRHARKVPARGLRGTRPARTVTGRERSARIRQWAKEEGIHVNDRGRIPVSVEAKYDAAHS